MPLGDGFGFLLCSRVVSGDEKANPVRPAGAQRSGGSTHAHGEAEDEYRVPWDDEVFFGGAPRIRKPPQRFLYIYIYIWVLGNFRAPWDCIY